MHASLLQHLSSSLLFNLTIVHVPPLIPMAISQSEEGFSMWLAIFLKPSRAVIKIQKVSNVVDLS